MNVSTRTVEGTHWVALSGELDISTAPEVEREVARLEKERPERVVIDLRELTFIDSTGLRVLLSADARCRAYGGELVLVQGPPAVHRVFRIALLDQRLSFTDDPSGLAGADG